MSEEQLSILLVDDDEVDRLIVKRALKKANLPTLLTEVQNGSKAISILLTNSKQSATRNSPKAKNNHKVSTINTNPSLASEIFIDRFDLILLDYRLPDMSGLQLIEQFKSSNVKIPIIILTGQGDEEIAVEIMKAGAADYLNKAKIAPDNLSKAIHSAIRLHKAEQAVREANIRLRASNELLVSKNQELERQQEQIKLQNIKLQKSYSLKSEFLATMSHELRTPMNAIIGFSQILLRQYPDPLSSQQKNLIQRILNNSQNLLEMINGMLDFSKIEAGSSQIKIEKFDLSLLTQITTEEIRSLALQKQLSLVADITLKNTFVIQDRNFTKRILINLLSNAIKFTERGEVRVKVWELDDDQIAISVADTGIGIAPEDHDKIFQAFRQGDQSSTRQHSGTGLGLAITESLVKMMGGKIHLTSTIAKGSNFTVKIPRKYIT